MQNPLRVIAPHFFIAIAVIAAHSARAQVSGTWVGGSFGDWSVGENWSSAPAFPSNGGAASFNPAVNDFDVSNVDVDVPVTINRIDIGNLFNPLRIDGLGMLSLTGQAEVQTARQPLDPSRPHRLNGVGGTAGMLITGGGMVGFESNNFSGDLEVRNAAIKVFQNSGLGNASNRVVLDGGEVHGDSSAIGTLTINRAIQLDPDGGTFRTGRHMFLPGVVSGSGDLHFRPAHTFGRLRLEGQNTYTGATHINDLGVGMYVGREGTIRNSSAININSGELRLENLLVTANVDRIGDSAPVTLNSGRLHQGSSAAFTPVERVGPMTLTGGARIIVDKGDLIASSLTRLPGASLRFDSGSTQRLLFDQAPALTGGGGPADSPTISILPYATSSSGTFCTYETGVGVRSLRASEFETNLANANINTNVRLGTPTAIDNALTVNALSLGAGTFGGTGSISIRTGALRLNTSTLSVPIEFSEEAVITGGGALTGMVRGSDGLTLSSGTLTLSAANEFSGPTAVSTNMEATINPSLVRAQLNVVGDVTPGSPGPLGTDSSPVRMSPQTKLEFAPTVAGEPVHFSRDVTFEGVQTFFAGGTLSCVGSSASTFSGRLQVDSDVSVTGDFQIAGPISGSGDFRNYGRITVSGDSDFSGAILHSTGTLILGSDSALGTGTFRSFEGVIGTTNGPHTIGNGFELFTELNFATGTQLQIDGPVEIGTVVPTATFSVPPDARVVLAGPVRGNPFDVVGGGTLVLNAASSFFSGVTAGYFTLSAVVEVTDFDPTVQHSFKVGAVSTVADSVIDLFDHSMHVVRGGSSYEQVTTQIRSARNGGAWDGPGIRSSTARDDPTAATTLGTLTGEQFISLQGEGAWFEAVRVRPADVLVKLTYYGDTDFNGLINFDDYARIDAGFNNGLSGWFNGDFDYSNSINFDDYALIDLAFNTQDGTILRALSYLDGSDRSDRGMNAPALRSLKLHHQQFGEAYVASFLNAVPEPGAALTTTCALLLFSCRRRARNF